MNANALEIRTFLPQRPQGLSDIVFTHGVWMGGRAGRRPVGRAVGKKFVRAVSQKREGVGS